MDAHLTDVMERVVEGSDNGKLTFPQVVALLMDIGVERYGADLSRSKKTFYMPDGQSHTVAAQNAKTRPAQDFSPSGVQAAIRSIQAGEISYPAFCEQMATAGCVFYIVSIVGRRAVYFGRSGESHVELFPGAR